MFNLVLFGPPGSGKGTQSANIIEKYKLVHISTGDILRNEVSQETPLGLEAKKYMDQGALVPDEVVIGMISSKLDENPEVNGFIFDGFPRTVAQADALDNLLDFRQNPINLVLSLKVSEEELKNRLEVTYRQARKSKQLWQDPKKIKKLKNLLFELERLIESESEEIK
jgi:adenylate kinase